MIRLATAELGPRDALVRGPALPHPDEPPYDQGFQFDVRRCRQQDRDLADRAAEATCDAVYATAGYEQSPQALARVSLETDGVFGDDAGVHELGTVSGSIAGGLTVDLAVPVRST